MLRTILMTGLIVLAGLFLLKVVFAIFGVFLGLTAWLLVFAVQALIVGGVVYLVIRVVSPETARRLRERWSGTSVSRY